MREKKKSSESGVTLSEMMVVLIIISVIGVLIVPNILDRPDQARITVARTDIKSIESAIELYKLDNLNYPTTEQGLKALVEKPAVPPIPTNWNKSGYLKKLPVDPWGKPYMYENPGKRGSYDIYSFGSDGVAGGEDKNADIGNWE